MKYLILIALSLMLTPAVHAEVDQEMVLAALSNSRQVAARHALAGKSVKIPSTVIINKHITNTHRIQVNLEVQSYGETKEVDARLVVLLNNEHGGIILDINKILSPLSWLSAKTVLRYQGDNVITLTKMYIPVDLSSPGALIKKLNTLSNAIESGRLGTLHAKR